ncbi:hypothetical protein Tco_0039528 [Tanacetum coccineum]
MKPLGTTYANLVTNNKIQPSPTQPLPTPVTIDSCPDLSKKLNHALVGELYILQTAYNLQKLCNEIRELLGEPHEIFSKEHETNSEINDESATYRDQEPNDSVKEDQDGESDYYNDGMDGDLDFGYGGGWFFDEPAKLVTGDSPRSLEFDNTKRLAAEQPDNLNSPVGPKSQHSDSHVIHMEKGDTNSPVKSIRDCHFWETSTSDLQATGEKEFEKADHLYVAATFDTNLERPPKINDIDVEVNKTIEVRNSLGYDMTGKDRDVHGIIQVNEEPQ